MSESDQQDAIERIAVIGMSGCFPGARNVEEFWRNLRDGVESISTFADDELLSLGVDREQLDASGYVRARGVLSDTELFDASFFGFSPREAEIIDPQLRFFLEHSWAALENAAYDPETYDGLIGIYGGMSMGEYLFRNLMPNQDVVKSAGGLQLRILNDKDFLTSLVSYKLNFKGPTVNVQTACSTSLVAVHMACQSLLSYQCDMALAGGVSVTVPQKLGYQSQEGVYSPDGHCRPFDAAAAGTVGGNGVGIVVLKRLSDALNDGDNILAVIRGSAINNDGSLKVGYTAPSVDGQAEVIAMAQAVAGVNPETITYIEAHGTGTPLGDPIEIAALTQVFSVATEKKGFCAVGSIKANVGHADAAAGIMSLIKVILALRHETLPPSINFNHPTPQIDFDSTPFYVNDRLRPWTTDGFPRRAGISAFAIGGINAHLVVEEAPHAPVPEQSRPWQLALLSARSEAALEQATGDLAVYLKEHPNLHPADVAYSLQVGRRAFDQRRAVVYRDTQDLQQALDTRDPRRLLTAERQTAALRLAFMFPGLGNHYVNMGWQLYQLEPIFRQTVDECCELLRPHLGLDLRDVIYPARRSEQAMPDEAARNPTDDQPRAGLNFRKMLGREAEDDEATRKLNQTVYTQPALFVIEYALARLWMSWGVEPQALIGYSIGEYVAACLSGVFSLSDALLIVVRRAQLIQRLPQGAMLAVQLPRAEVEAMLDGKLDIAAVNGPEVCVVAGASDAVEELERTIAARGATARRLQTTHAFHSRMLEPIVGSFVALMKSIKLNPPRLPIISNVTGTRLDPTQATDPNYWATHMCRTVLFGEGIQELCRDHETVLLEVGPGQALGAWALQHSAVEKTADTVVLASLRHSYDQQPDLPFLLNTLGRLWMAGVNVDWQGFYGEEQRTRLPLPTYPFERKRYWIDPPLNGASWTRREESPKKKADPADWFYLSSWKELKPLAFIEDETLRKQMQRYLIFSDECGTGERLAQRLERAGQDVTVVRAGENFARSTERAFVLNPGRAEDYEALLKELRAAKRMPQVVCHLWGLTRADEFTATLEETARHQDRGFYSLIFLAQALGNRQAAESLRLAVVTNGVHAVSGVEQLCPAKATVLGVCKVIPQEYPQTFCRSIDVVLHEEDAWETERLTGQLLSELLAGDDEQVIAYRGSKRWVQTFEPVGIEPQPDGKTLVREGGVYLVTGGLGEIGLVLADYLARAAKARLVLVGRSAFPARDEWDGWLAAHDAGEPTARRIKRVRALEESGAEVLIYRADVAVREQMEQMLAVVHERFGSINGVIHAAGVQPGGMIQLKTREAAAKVLAPKVEGTLVLDAVLADEKLDFIALCSSLNSFIGAFGLADHCAANAFLDAYAHDCASRNKPYTFSINWDAWLEAGQAANAAYSSGLQNIMQQARRSEIDHPLLDSCITDEPDRLVYSTELSTAIHWILDEHRIMGEGVVPGTAYLEMVRAAFAGRAEGSLITLRNVALTTPLIVREGETREAQIVFTKEKDAYSFSVVSREATQSSSPWQEHINGEIATIQAETPPLHNIEELLEKLETAAIERSPQDNGRTPGELSETQNFSEQTRNFGARWKGLVRRVGIGDGEAVAYLELPAEFNEDLRDFIIHPSLMDAATGFVQVAGEGFYLPLAYKKITVNAPLPAKIYSHARFNQNDRKEILACDITITDESGRPLIEIEEYLLRRINDTSAFDARPVTQSSSPAANPQPGLAADGEANRHVEAGGRENVQGLLSREGAEVFDRMMRSGLHVTQLAVATVSLKLLVEQSRSYTGTAILEEVERVQARRRKHPRPNLSVPYTAARNGIEQELASMWQEVLGLEEVGVHDNFFDMGGDSLLATQLIGRLGEAFQVDLSLRNLFESPTVGEIALTIVQRQAQQVESGQLAELLAQIKHLSREEIEAMMNDNAKGSIGS
jgi:acyl transferase domain-containing protein